MESDYILVLSYLSLIFLHIFPFYTRISILTRFAIT